MATQPECRPTPSAYFPASVDQPTSVAPSQIAGKGEAFQTKLILSIGDDPQLLHVREMVMRSAGYRVLSTPSAGLANRDTLACDVVVICHTLVSNQDLVFRTVRQMLPVVPVLLLKRFDSRSPDSPRRVIRPFPSVLLATLRDLLDRGRNACVPATTPA